MGLFDFLTGKVSADAFATLVMKRLRADGDATEYTYDKEAFSLRGENQTKFLSNMYHDYVRAKRGDREAVLKAYLGAYDLKDRPDDYPSVKAKLMPAIRSRFFQYRASGVQTEGSVIPPNGLRASDLCTQPLGDDRSVYLVVDDEHAMSYVAKDSAEKWGVSTEQMMGDAINNLRDRTTDKWTTVVPHLYVGNWGDSYDCSRILLPDLIYRLNLPGRPVALVPVRGDVYVSSDQLPDLQMAMFKLAQDRMQENNRWCSYSALVLDQGKWLPFSPPNEVVRAALQKLRCQMMATEYADQKEMLEADLHTANNPAFVASLMVFETKDTGGLWSAASWANGVDTYLPLADKIVFSDEAAPDAAPLVVDWDAAYPIVAPLMTALPTYPPRFQVTTFPDAAMQVKLRALAG
jgi:hypothetical protein